MKHNIFWASAYFGFAAVIASLIYFRPEGPAWGGYFVAAVGWLIAGSQRMLIGTMEDLLDAYRARVRQLDPEAP